MKIFGKILACCLGLSLLCMPALAQDGEMPNEEPEVEVTETSDSDSKWQFEIIPVLWLANQEVSIQGRGVNVNTNIRATDVVDKIEFAFGGRFSGRKDKWGFMIDGNHVRITDTANIQPANLAQPVSSVTPDIRNSVFQGVGTYRIADGEKAAADFLFGFRAYDMDITMGVAPLVPNPALPAPITIEKNLSFVDPIIGVTGNAALGKKVDFFYYGDIGGFGVGSDFTFRVDAGIDWKVSKSTSILLGGTVMDFDYTSGSGIDRFQYKNTQYGPMLGARFKL